MKSESYTFTKLTYGFLLFLFIRTQCVNGVCRYGSDLSQCAFLCRCTNNRCNPDTGECLQGERCIDGQPPGYKLSGPACQVTSPLIRQQNRRIKLMIGHKVSLPIKPSTEELINPDLNKGHCAHPTAHTSQPAWWSVDLGGNHLIYNITLYIRNQAKDRNDFKVTIGSNEDPTQATQEDFCYQMDPSNIPSQAYHFTFTCDKGNVTGRYVGFIRTDKWNAVHHAALCEVVVFGVKLTECSDKCVGQCDKISGCSKCGNGTRLPDCFKSCTYGKYGDNCESLCPARCTDSGDRYCNIYNGTCDNGCDYDKDGDWYTGDYCTLQIPSIGVNKSSEMQVQIKTNGSVTLRWKQTPAIPRQIAKYYGYYLYYSVNATSNWTRCCDVTYNPDVEWQEAEITNLELDTLYVGYISMYRADNGMKYENNVNVSSIKYIFIEREKTAVTAPQSGSGADPTIIGAASGGAIFLIILVIIIVIVVIFLKRRKSQSQDEKSKPNSNGRNHMNHESSHTGGGAYENVGMLSEMTPISKRRHERSEEQSEKTPDTIPIPAKKLPPKQKRTHQIPGVHQEEEYENATALIKSKPVKLVELEAFIRSNSGKGIEREFDAIPTEVEKEQTAARNPKHKKKNRFRNIYPYDDTRVPLEQEYSNEQDDYINASYITGHNGQPRAYIATQAPTKATINDFWKMIWVTKANRIVMVTRLVENIVRKSEEYWPQSAGENKTCGGITVTTLSIETLADYMITIIELEMKGKTQTVRHFQFLQWPDKSVPDRPLTLLNFRNKVRSFDNISRGPMVVHCSAGIGRTGTFIAINILLQQADRKQEVDLVKLTYNLREERMKMIQTLAQYEFIYASMMEYSISGSTGIPCGQLAAKMKDTNSASLFEKQFQALDKYRPTLDTEGSEGLAMCNIDKNRYKDIIPTDVVRPFISTKIKGRTNYINAAILNTYKSQDGVIATQMPLPDTVVDFWCMVWDLKCDTIIMLNDKATHDQTSGIYWPDVQHCLSWPPFEVTTENVNKHGCITTREISITNTKKLKIAERPRVVKQFQLTTWKSGDNLPSTSGLLELMDAIEQWRRQGNAGRAVVHCMDGATRCGIYCTAAYLLEKMKVDQEVNVFFAVRMTYDRRPQFIPSLVCTVNDPKGPVIIYPKGVGVEDLLR